MSLSRLEAELETLLDVAEAKAPRQILFRPPWGSLLHTVSPHRWIMGGYYIPRGETIARHGGTLYPPRGDSISAQGEFARASISGCSAEEFDDA